MKIARNVKKDIFVGFATIEVSQKYIEVCGKIVYAAKFGMMSGRWVIKPVRGFPGT